jgi:hypothetical protein
MRKIEWGKLKVSAITWYEINKSLGTNNLQEQSLKEVIPKEYNQFQSLFIKVITK